MKRERLHPSQDHKFAFTLIELLVVIAIISLLASLLFPVIGNALNKGKRASTISNLRQLAMGFDLYASDNDGMLPYGYVPGGSDDINNWQEFLVQGSYVGGGYDGRAYDLPVMGSPLQRKNNRDLPKWTVATFSANAHVLNSNLPDGPYLRFFDVPSKTLLVSEGSTHGNNTFNTLLFGSSDTTLPDYLTDGEVSCAFLDGHVETMPLASWPDFSAASDGNEAWAFWFGQ